MSRSVNGDPKIDKDFIKLISDVTEATESSKIRNLDRKTIVNGIRALGHALIELETYERIRGLQSDGGKKGAMRLHTATTAKNIEKEA